MMQTGHLFRGGQEYPHYGAVLSAQRGTRVEGMPSFVVLPAPIGNTGVSVEHGQGAGGLGARHEPFILQADPARLPHDRAMLDAVDSAIAPSTPTLRAIPRSLPSSPLAPRTPLTSLARRTSCVRATGATPSANRACWHGG